ncbi:MAG: glycosyltransferase family 2 protein [Candidatus Krumholzibacteriia bacterium]
MIRTEHPRLSACLIVRDEARFLDACLDSLEGRVDEIVACDTGSRDGSLDLLRRRATVVIERPWRDDFSLARNAVLAVARGEWILCLDADERLRTESDDLLRRALDAAEALAYRLEVVDHVDASVAGTVGPETVGPGGTTILRLFRNRPDIRFTGRVHEQVSPAVAAVVEREPIWRVGPLAGVVIDHLGYDPSLKDQDQKRRRNLDLLRLELAAAPDSPYHLYQLYRNDPGDREGQDALRKAAALVLAMPQPRLRGLGYAHALLTAAAFQWLRDGDAAAAERAAGAAVHQFGDHPAALLARALALEKLARYGEALLYVERSFTVHLGDDAFTFEREPALHAARLLRRRLRRRGRAGRGGRADRAGRAGETFPV